MLNCLSTVHLFTSLLSRCPANDDSYDEADLVVIGELLTLSASTAGGTDVDISQPITTSFVAVLGVRDVEKRPGTVFRHSRKDHCLSANATGRAWVHHHHNAGSRRLAGLPRCCG